MKKISLVFASMFVLSGCDKLGLNNMFKKLMFWNNIYKEVSEDEFIQRFMETANKYNIVLKDNEVKQFIVSPNHNGKLTNIDKLHITLGETYKEETTAEGVEHNNETTVSQDLQIDLINNSGYSKQYSKQVGEYPHEYDAEIWLVNNKEYTKIEGEELKIEDYEGDFIDDFAYFLLNLLDSGALPGIMSKTFYSYGAIVYNGGAIIPDSFNVKYELSRTAYRYSLEYTIAEEKDEYVTTSHYKETLCGGNFLVDECSIYSKIEANSHTSDYKINRTSNAHYIIDSNLQIPNIG